MVKDKEEEEEMYTGIKRVKSHDFKFTIAANLITGTEIKLRNGWNASETEKLSLSPSSAKKDGFSSHKLHTISFKRITNLPIQVNGKSKKRRFKGKK